MCVLNIYIYIYIRCSAFSFVNDICWPPHDYLFYVAVFKPEKEERHPFWLLFTNQWMSLHFYSPTVATLSSVSFFSFFKTHLLCRGRGSVQCVSPGLYVSLKFLRVFCLLELCFVVFCHCCHFILFCLFIIMSIKKTCWGGDGWSLHFFCFQNTCMRNKWPKKSPSGLRVFHCP